MERIGQIFAEHSWWVWILIGLVAGILAKLLTPGRDPGGFIVTILIGIAGAVLAALIGDLLQLGDRSDTTSIISATVGAIILLLLYRLVTGRRRV